MYSSAEAATRQAIRGPEPLQRMLQGREERELTSEIPKGARAASELSLLFERWTAWCLPHTIRRPRGGNGKVGGRTINTEGSAGRLRPSRQLSRGLSTFRRPQT